jgi:hypothetical protein
MIIERPQSVMKRTIIVAISEEDLSRAAHAAAWAFGRGERHIE